METWLQEKWDKDKIFQGKIEQEEHKVHRLVLEDSSPGLQNVDFSSTTCCCFDQGPFLGLHASEAQTRASNIQYLTKKE